MFIQNKYYRCYYNIINRSKSRTLTSYCEVHHIIPRSLGGTDDESNLVKLTAREHFICHWLLTKFTESTNRRSMIFAFNALANLNNSLQSRYTPKTYELVRKIYAAEKSKEMQGAGNHMFGKKHRVDSKEKMSRSKKGKIPWNAGLQLSDEHKQKISVSNKGENNFMFGKLHSSEAKKKISEKNAGHSRNKGIPKTDEHKEKISNSLQGKKFTDSHKLKLKSIPKITCIYCNKLVSPAMHKRWHGDLCKIKTIT